MQIQLRQPLSEEHRFARHICEHGEGLHHTCLSVDDSLNVVDRAVAASATLKERESCQLDGINEHPEGWIAVLAGESVRGMDIAFMQV